MDIKILGVDPSLNNFAMSVVGAQIETSKKTIQTSITVEKVELIRTNSQDTDLERAMLITDAFLEYAQTADLVIAELPHGSRSARASWTLGIVLGILACSTKPIITVDPKQVKAITGKKSATKDQMLSWALKNFPEAKWFRDAKGKPYKYNHHIADSLAAIVAGITYKKEEFSNGTALFTKKQNRKKI